MGRRIKVVYESGVLRPLDPLPFAEHQELTVEIVEEDKKEENTSEPDLYRKKEMAWLGLHSKEYAGEYVALFGDRLVAHHKDASEVYRQSDAAGVERPLISYIPPADEPPFGGW
jgi:predicted DNA-binding antitoxin AbrB/MazE fold protein